MGLVAIKNQQKSKRITSIDVARGLIIILMLIGENQGYGNRYYEQLNHAPWNGVTLIDFAFPLFVLIMGTAIPIVIDRKIKNGESRSKIILEALKRTLILISLGLILNFISNSNLSTMRIPGVLQRLGFVYFASSLIYLFVNKIIGDRKIIVPTLLIITGVIIVGYYVISKPYGFDIDRNLPQIVDVMLLNGHLHTPTFDPEGIVTNIVAIASGLIGCIIGCIITNYKTTDLKKVINLIVIGGIFIVCAFEFNKVFPFNKRLWSSSFILLTGGTYSVLLGILHLICDVGRVKKVFTPVIALGVSPLFVYFTSELIGKIIRKLPVNVYEYITLNYFTPVVGEVYDSLAFAIVYTLMWIVLATMLTVTNISKKQN